MPSRIRNCKNVREMKRIGDDFVKLNYKVVSEVKKCFTSQKR